MKRACDCLWLIVMSLVFVGSPVWAVVDETPMIYFNFDEAVGDTVPDASGKGHDGVLAAGAEIIASPTKYGAGALQIEGGDETMAVESFPELENYQANTFLFWINFTDPASGGWDQIIAKPAPGSDRSPGMWVTPEGLSIHYRYNPGNLGPWGITPTGNRDGNFFKENTWYHVAVATAAGNLIAYVDGQEVAQETVPAEFAQGAGKLFIGNSEAYGGPAAKFIIDDFAIYSRALRSDEIIEIMNGSLAVAVEARGKLASVWGDVKQD